MNERLDRFNRLLKQIFELDKSDLDFGIYRIMNLRRAEIEKFLTEGLPKKVLETLAPFAQKNKDEIRGKMAEIEKNIYDFGMEFSSLPENNPMAQKYRSLQKQLAEGADIAALETDVYSSLYSFFNRYYEDGDFISKRRYKEGVYAIPYEGEEVKLYWANQDQYYIKTSENFKDYTFVYDDITIHFRMVDATTEQNNNKERKNSKRTFMLFTEDEENYPSIKTFEYDSEARELIIRFVYDIPEDKKKKYAEETYASITNWLLSLRRAEFNPLIAPISTDKGKETTTLLEKHLKGYVAKNTFDYFIHKDLRGFLTRELDFYIKSEVMHLEDLDTGNEARVEVYLAKIKAIKRVGKIIIDFLAQMEEFQKKLWLKKKFVVETNWCITLDKISKSFWPEIITNNTQINEWIAMYAIDEATGWSNPSTVDFLHLNQNLVIDTRHFSEDFKLRLLESIDDLDEQTNGLMINGDNYHALHLIKEKSKDQIDAIYIDPPYNSTSSEILYKNSYKHSAWLSLMQNRLELSRSILKKDGIITVAIDDYEMPKLWELMNSIYGYDNHLGTVCIRINPKGRMTARKISAVHEYTLLFGNSVMATVKKLPENPEDKSHNYKQDEDGIWHLPNNLRKQGVDSEAEKSDGTLADRYFPIYYDPITGRVSSKEKLSVTIIPIDESGYKRIWRRGFDVIDSMYETGDIWVKKIKGEYQVYYKFYGGLDGKMVQSMWTEAECSASDYGTKILDNILGRRELFSYPKAPYAVTKNILAMSESKNARVLDFFAGSGTTGHAVVNLNREDNGNRKYILVEMGEYFDTVTKPRMQKVIYSADWKNGKPQNRNTGVSQIIKYMRLESYEDALSNIKLADNGVQMSALFGDEYMIHYMVDLESRGSLLNVEAFSNPFAYTMKITEKNECKERGIDLCETFNYLIGLTVFHQSAISYFRSKPATTPSYEGAVELISDIDGQYAFHQIEGTLLDGCRALIIWRTVTDNILASNAALDAYFTTYRTNSKDRSYDVIFINGDNNLENLRNSNEGWNVKMIETEFKKLMFEEV